MPPLILHAGFSWRANKSFEHPDQFKVCFFFLLCLEGIIHPETSEIMQQHETEIRDARYGYGPTRFMCERGEVTSSFSVCLNEIPQANFGNIAVSRLETPLIVLKILGHREMRESPHIHLRVQDKQIAADV